MNWIIKHASRTLIKKGFKKAFALHGIEESNIKVSDQKILTKNVKVGSALKVSLTLVNQSKKAAQVILDHELHLLKANGKHTIKVFKGKKITLKPGEKQKCEMAIPLKVVTTRVYYPGKHFWNSKVNGVSAKALPFELLLK